MGNAIPGRGQDGGARDVGAKLPLTAAGAGTAHRDFGWVVRGLAGLGVFLLACWAYWPALDGRPLWDDEAHLTAPELRSWSGLARIWIEPGATQQYYPVLHSAFWLEHRLWADDVRGYHAINLVQHLLGASLFGTLLLRLKVPGAWLAAAVFVLHPVHAESVAWMSEQKNTLSLVFYLAAALAYVRFDASRSRWAYLIAAGFFVLALLTKSVTATLPAALLVVFWWQRGRFGWSRDVWPLVPWFLVGATAGLFTATVERYLIGAGAAEFALSGLQRGLLAGRVVWFYAANLLWPANLTFIYPRWTIDPSLWATWWPSLLFLAVSLTLWLWRRRMRAPLAAWLLFSGTLFPVLGFFDVFPFQYSYVADHFQYLANLPLIAGLTAAWVHVWRSKARLALMVTAVGILGSLTWLTRQETPKYRNNLALYQATLQRNPGCWMAHNNLALLLSGAGAKQAAIAHLRRALALYPDYFDAHNNLGLTLTQLGEAGAALPHLDRAVTLRPDAARAHTNRGIALAALRRPTEAVGAFIMAAHLMPDAPSVHENLGKALRLVGRSAESEAALRRAQQLREAQAKGPSPMRR